MKQYYPSTISSLGDKSKVAELFDLVRNTLVTPGLDLTCPRIRQRRLPIIYSLEYDVTNVSLCHVSFAESIYSSVSSSIEGGGEDQTLDPLRT